MEKADFGKKHYIKKTMKVIGIVRNDITGIKYGLVEVPVMIEVVVAQHNDKQNTPIKNHKKHGALKSTLSKQENFEQETKAASKTTKAKATGRETIKCSNRFFTKAQKPVDLRKKRHQKNQTLFKKKQRDKKIALQNMMQKIDFIEPLFDCILALGQNQKTK